MATTRLSLVMRHLEYLNGLPINKLCLPCAVPKVPMETE